jgi:hypothetical protein
MRNSPYGITVPFRANATVNKFRALRDPLGGGRRALVALRPVPLDRLEGLVLAKPTAAVLRERRSFAHEMVFGSKPRLLKKCEP